MHGLGAIHSPYIFGPNDGENLHGCLGPSLNAGQVFAAIMPSTCGRKTEIKNQETRQRKSYNTMRVKSQPKSKDSVSPIRSS